jgi:hypothetical protein
MSFFITIARMSVAVQVYFVEFVPLCLISELSPFPQKSFCFRKSIGVVAYSAAFALVWFISELSPFDPKLPCFRKSVEDCWVYIRIVSLCSEITLFSEVS